MRYGRRRASSGGAARDIPLVGFGASLRRCDGELVEPSLSRRSALVDSDFQTAVCLLEVGNLALYVKIVFVQIMCVVMCFQVRLVVLVEAFLWRLDADWRMKRT